MTSPSQNTGIEIPMSARIMSNGSKMLPFSTAAATPMMIATTTQMHGRPEDERQCGRSRRDDLGNHRLALVRVRHQVAGDEELLHHDDVPDRNGLSRPNWCLISVRACGDGFRPAICAGRVDARRLEEDQEHEHRDHEHHQQRPQQAADDEGGTISLPDAQLGAGIEGITDPVAEHVQRQHGQHDHDPRGDRHPRPGVEQVLAVADDRAPAGVRRLDAHRRGTRAPTRSGSSSRS